MSFTLFRGQHRTASKASTSPPALRTAIKAASLSFRRFSRASCSRRALVLELPLGATPVRILWLSSGVKLTKETAMVLPEFCCCCCCCCEELDLEDVVADLGPLLLAFESLRLCVRR